MSWPRSSVSSRTTTVQRPTKWDRSTAVFLGPSPKPGPGPTTVNRAFGNVRAFFNWVVCEDYLAVSPCAKIKVPQVPQVIKPLISQEQFEQILSLCPANT